MRELLLSSSAYKETVNVSTEIKHQSMDTRLCVYYVIPNNILAAYNHFLLQGGYGAKPYSVLHLNHR